jgi:hypothetical protein
MVSSFVFNGIAGGMLPRAEADAYSVDLAWRNFAKARFILS